MMSKEKLSFVFFGSGPVAAENLRLLTSEFTIEAIITKPATSQEMRSISPDSPLFTVENKAELDALFFEHKFSSEVGVLIDFGIIVSQQIIDYFLLGIVNSHFSLLPELRGADPISFALLEGKEKTGVSLMLLVEAMDEGPVLSMEELILDGTETATILTDKLVDLSARMLSDSLPKYMKHELQLSDQVGEPSYTRKLTKQDGVIDWNKSAEQIEREIRAFIEWPKSRTKFNNLDIIIISAHTTVRQGKPGKLVYENKELLMFCGKNALVIDKLKPAGKSVMDAASFINGYKRLL